MNPQSASVTRKTPYFRVILMGVSAFVVNTTEFVPVALLSDIAKDFAITTAEAGWMLTLYAWIVALMSLPLMLLTGKMERKKLLLMVFVMFIASHLLSVLAWSFNVLLVSRVGIAFSHAIFWSITASITLRVAPAGKKALALGVLGTGTSLAMVLGVPLGRMVGQWFGWRTTIAGIGAVAFAVGLLQAKLLPTLPSMFEGSIKKVPELLKKPLLIGLYVFCFLIFTAHYTAYAYIEPFMREVGGIVNDWVTFVLLVFGGAGIVGSVLFSRWGDRYNKAMMVIATMLLVVCLLALLATVTSIWSLSMLAFIWGTIVMVLLLAVQAKVIMIDLKAQDMLMSLFSGIINLGIGAGALLGGYVVTHLSLPNVGYVGAAVAGLALLLIFGMVKHFPALR